MTNSTLELSIEKLDQIEQEKVLYQIERKKELYKIINTPGIDLASLRDAQRQWLRMGQV